MTPLFDRHSWKRPSRCEQNTRRNITSAPAQSRSFPQPRSDTIKSTYPRLRWLVLLLFLNACEKHAVDFDRPFSDRFVTVAHGESKKPLVLVHVRIYTKSSFDAAVLEVKDKAEETKRNILAVAETERESVEHKLHYQQLEKTQTEAAREVVERMLTSPHDEIPVDVFREQMLSFTEKLIGIEKSMEEYQQALIRTKGIESEAQRLTSRDQVLPAVLDKLQKPVEQVNTDADGKFQVSSKSNDPLVVVTDPSHKSTHDVSVYRTNVRPSGKETQEPLLLSLYNWNADAR